MKKNIKLALIKKILAVFLLMITASTYAQQYNELDNTNNRLGKSISEILASDDILVFQSKTENCCTEDPPSLPSIPNFIRFDYSLLAPNPSDRHEDLTNLIKGDIERILDMDFNNLFDAVEGWTKVRVANQVKNSAASAQREISTKVRVKENYRKEILTDLKVLQLREDEIKSGNINNSQYGNLKYYDTYLDDIRTLSEIDDFKNGELRQFQNNQWRLEQEQEISAELREIVGLNDLNHPVLDRLGDLRIEELKDTEGDKYDNLNTISIYVYGMTIPNLLEHDLTKYPTLLSDSHLVRNGYVTEYVWPNNPGDRSIFHPDKDSSSSIQKQREDHIRDALEDIDLSDIITDVAIEALGTRNADFIKRRPELKAEIENYFELNDHSKLSNDCVNYLLNQYLDGGNFTLGENYYQSASTPIFNSPGNNIAMSTSLNSIAIRDEFTYFNNVLSALFASNHIFNNKDIYRPEYEGQILREVFQANNTNIPSGISNEMLSDYFDFTPTSNNRIQISHARGHGDKRNIGSYLNDLKEFNDAVETLLQTKPAPGSSTFAFVDYENRIAEALEFTNDSDALIVAELFQTNEARDAFLNAAHHNAIAQCGLNILQATTIEQLEITKLDPEGIRIVNIEAAQVATIIDLAEEFDEANSSFWPQNGEEWEAVATIMGPLLFEVGIGFIPGSDIRDLYISLSGDEPDILGASIATAGLLVDVAGLRAVRGTINSARVVRKAFIIARKLRNHLKAIVKATQKGFSVATDVLGNLILKRGGEIIAQGDDVVKEVLEKISKPGRKFWTETTTFRNVKVYKRDDIINGSLVDNVGRTNKQRMQSGIAPIGPDGKSVNLHHMLQSDSAGIAEMTETFHKTNHATIHINPNTIPSGIDRSAFATWKRNYWKNRANDF